MYILNLNIHIAWNEYRHFIVYSSSPITHENITLQSSYPYNLYSIQE